ncbi:hypothetical protein [Catellatospora methionotrophica]|uniref:hypothetical protein n=1 Tax=Catellatospora methionotrophica TaxID=121620 RepID=UPI0033CDC05B
MTEPRYMRTALAISRLASAALPVSGASARYREQWEADIRGAAEMGLSPLRLALGTVVAAAQLAGTLRKDELMLASASPRETVDPLPRPALLTVSIVGGMMGALLSAISAIAIVGQSEDSLKARLDKEIGSGPLASPFDGSRVTAREEIISSGFKSTDAVLVNIGWIGIALAAVAAIVLLVLLVNTRVPSRLLLVGAFAANVYGGAQQAFELEVIPSISVLCSQLAQAVSVASGLMLMLPPVVRYYQRCSASRYLNPASA